MMEEYGWNCENCTFINGSQELACTMCFRPRLALKEQDVVWYWQAADEWITYDAETSEQIETARSSGEDSVDLTKGFFAGNPGYSVIKDKHSIWQQLNTGTGNIRLVRRIGSDSDHIFIKLDLKDVTENQNLCSICQETFDASKNPYKLPSCKSHYFHRDCVSQWVKLHIKCPTCNQSVF